MKNIYKVFIFFMMFQMMAVVIAALNVFPSGAVLYSDIDIDEIEARANDPVQIISYFITPTGGYTSFPSNPGGVLFSINVILLAAGIGGAVVGFITKNVGLAMMGIIAAMFVPMISKSMTFFQVIFSTWNVSSLSYLGVTIGVGLVTVLIITLLETPTHGKSGE